MKHKTKTNLSRGHGGIGQESETVLRLIANNVKDSGTCGQRLPFLVLHGQLEELTTRGENPLEPEIKGTFLRTYTKNRNMIYKKCVVNLKT